MPGALCCCAFASAGWCLAWAVLVWPACQRARLDSGSWCFGQRHARLVLLVRRRLCLLLVGVLGWLWSAVGLRPRLCCLRVLCCCLSAGVVVRGVVVLGLGCRRVCYLTAGDVWFGLVVLVVVFQPEPCGACFVCSVLSLPPYGLYVWVAVVGGWVAVVAVLIAWPSLVLRWCAAPLLVGRAVLVRARPHAGVCCVGVWPPHCGVCCVDFLAPLMVGRAVLVRGAPHGGACCVGARRQRWWCVVWWCLAWVVVVCWVAVAVVLFASLGLVLCWCVPNPPCWGVPCLWMAPPLVARAVLVCSGFGSWCCSQFDAWLVLLVRCCVCRRTAGVVGCWLSVVFAWPWLVLCWCLPTPCWGVLCLCVAPPMVGHAVLVSAPPMVGRAALACGPPHGVACCVSAWPPSWWGVLCWCLPAAVVMVWLGCRCLLGGLQLRLCCLLGRGRCCAGAWPPPVGACRVCALPPPWWGVLCWRVWVSVRGVVAGSMLGLFCWFAVVSAAVWPALSSVGCLWCLPGRGWCCAGARPPPCWGMLCLCVSPPKVGRAVLVCAPPMVGRAVLVCGPPHGVACCVGAWPPSWWGVQCWCLPAALLVVGSGRRRLLGGLRLRFCCLLGRGWCCAGAWPPPVGACRDCAWPPPW